MAYICVDLDGTLAHYRDGDSIETIGRPIRNMVQRVKRWLEQNMEVRIFTARAAKMGEGVPTLNLEQVKMIEDWCLEHIGQKLPVQFWKDYETIEIWDDRAIRVLPNIGMRADYLNEQFFIS